MQFLFALPFLATGCTVFIICASLVRWRRFALSLSLWCVALGPCFVISIVIGFVLMKVRWLVHIVSLMRHLDITSPVIISVILASAAAMIHDRIMLLLTQSVFRIYVTGVSSGVGILSGFLLIIAAAIASIHIPAANVVDIIFVFLLGLGFGVFAYLHSSEFRRIRKSPIGNSSLPPDNSSLADITSSSLP